MKNNIHLLLFLFFFILNSSFLVSCHDDSVLSSDQTHQINSILGEDSLGHFGNGIVSSSAAEAPGPASEPSGTLVLAGSRTKRPDILNRFKKYRGGWDITNKHYWASVGFTGAAAFIIAIIWFVFFGLAMITHHYFRWRIDIKGKESQRSQILCLVLLIVFTLAAATGCILLSVGQDEFHSEAIDTLNYVVNQSDYTVQTLVNITGYLALAKTVNVAQFYLPSDVKDSIDKLNIDLNKASDTLGRKTHQNSQKIRTVFDAVRSSMITVAIVMLLVSILGLYLSILGHKNAIHLFTIGGWLLVVVTLLLCGVFVILNNAISDTCMAMGQWVNHQHAETALSNILPCVDQSTTNQTLYKSKQSGPLMPYVCTPYDSQLQERECSSEEVSMSNASLVWQNYTCTVTESGLCTSTGRLTPEMYQQLTGAVNISYALQHYTPPLLSFQDCNFVRETFTTITSNHCRPLQRHLHLVNAGLVLVSVGIMLSLALWIVYANRPQREEVFAKITSKIKGKCNVKLCRDDHTIVDVPASNIPRA
uniref:Ion transport domain-containing protein n=1 Tax=Tanacetum cinerariifolium TaxID=118510 RepID=A0A6L2LTR8_TANCI|nr:ion transport domain-containing protein [Tanacetum cinerariifolium]